MSPFRGLVRAGAALMLVVIGGCAVSAAPFGDENHTVTAEFDNAAGLYVGNAVAVLGMPVGEITAIHPHGAYVEVTMSVDGEVDIPADAMAVALSTSVLTDRHVEFTPAHRGGPVLADGARIGLDHTRTPVEFDRLLGAADRMSGDLQGQTPADGPVARLLSAAAAISTGSGDQLRGTLDELATALRLGEDGGAEMRELVTRIVDQLAQLMRAAADNDQTVRQFASATGQLGDVMAELNLGTGDTGAQLVEILRQSDALLTENAGLLNNTVTNAATVTKSLADYHDELAEFLDVTPLLLNNAYAAVDFENRGVRVHALLDKVFFDGQLVKEVCNILGLRQLGCATGTLQDFGPDFGITDMLTAMAGLPR